MNAGLGNDNLGVLMADFSLDSDGGASSTAVQVRIIGGGIPDREFGDGVHDFLYLPVTSTTGEVWLNNNLGADYANINHASFDLSQQAKSLTDPLAYGSTYQWGRYSDGHEIRTSGAIGTTNATTAVPNTGGAWEGLFITEPNSPYDWLTTPDPKLWKVVSGTNNPCPSGYRLPTETEWETERTAWGSNNAAGAFTSLKLPVAGFRGSSNGALTDVGSDGFYWSSAVRDPNARALNFDSSFAIMRSRSRAFGYSVRCIQD